MIVKERLLSIDAMFDHDADHIHRFTLNLREVRIQRYKTETRLSFHPILPEACLTWIFGFRDGKDIVARNRLNARINNDPVSRFENWGHCSISNFKRVSAFRQLHISCKNVYRFIESAGLHG